MTSDQIKTNNKQISIQIEASKDYYYAGDNVQGRVNMYCKKDDLSLKNLDVTLIVQLDQVQDKSVQNLSQSGRKQNSYIDMILLSKFANGTVPKGQYSFPFSFILPKSIPDSLKSFVGPNKISIKYSLLACLCFQEEQRQRKDFCFKQILQPLRLTPFGPIHDQKISDIQCCNFYWSYGVLKLRITCDKNYVRSGESILVQGQVDNTNGYNPIQNFKVQFIKHAKVLDDHTQECYLMFGLRKVVSPGQCQKFQFNATIPLLLNQSKTIVGKGIAIWFTLRLTSSSEIGCCNTYASSQVHLIKPPQSKAHNKPFGLDWNPVTAQLVTHYFNPFVFIPNKFFPYRNQKRNFNSVQNLEMMNQMNPMDPMNSEGTLIIPPQPDN